MHLLLGDQPLHRSARDQPVVEALVQSHIGVLQVDQVQPRRRPAQVLPAAEPLEQPQFGRPVQQLGALHRVALEQVEHVAPRSRRHGGARIGIAAVHQLGHPVQVDPLQRKGGQLAAVGKRDRGTQRRVAADDVHGVHRPGQREVGEVHALLDEVEHQRRGADLEIGRRLGEVGVADDDVQPAVLVGVGVRFVAGVDDAALERGLQADLDLDVVGALGQLEARARRPRGRRRRAPSR